MEGWEGWDFQRFYLLFVGAAFFLLGLQVLPFRCVAEVPRNDWGSRTVRDCTIPLERVPLLDETLPLADALAELGEAPVNRALVVEDGRLAGLLSITDVVSALEIRRLSGDGRSTSG